MKFMFWQEKFKHKTPSLPFGLPSPSNFSFPDSSAGKESTCNVGDLGSIPGLGRCPGEGKGYPLQYSSLENSMGCIVHGAMTKQLVLPQLCIVYLHYTLSKPPPSAGIPAHHNQQHSLSIKTTL